MLTEAAPPGRRLTMQRFLLTLFVVALAASHLVRRPHREPGPRPGEASVELAAVDGDRRLDTRALLAYREYGEDLGIRTPVILL
ncbi:MAG: hypothetical protein JSV80_00915, partial [Acidobacteriota bacterium]